MFKPSESIQTAPDTAVKAKDRKNHDVDLARWIAAAVRQHGGARKLRGYEQEALEQEVALNVLRADRRHGSPRDVLAWIDRCERMPATAARMEGATVSRLGALLPYQRARVLWRAVGSALESARWQEHSARYRSAADRQRNTGPMIQPSTGESGTVLALSLEHDSARMGTAANVGALAPLVDGPWSSVDVAIDLAYGQGWSSAQARNVALALERARSVALADSGTSRASATDVIRSVAAHRGVSVNSVEAAAKRGVSLLVAVDDAREVLRAIRHSARMATCGSQAARCHVDSVPGAPLPVVTATLTLAPLAAAAHSAVRQLALAGGAWDSESIHSARKMPERDARMIVDSGPLRATGSPAASPADLLSWMGRMESVSERVAVR